MEILATSMLAHHVLCYPAAQSGRRRLAYYLQCTKLLLSQDVIVGRRTNCTTAWWGFRVGICHPHSLPRDRVHGTVRFRDSVLLSDLTLSDRLVNYWRLPGGSIEKSCYNLHLFFCCSDNEKGRGERKRLLCRGSRMCRLFNGGNLRQRFRGRCWSPRLMLKEHAGWWWQPVAARADGDEWGLLWVQSAFIDVIRLIISSLASACFFHVLQFGVN